MLGVVLNAVAIMLGTPIGIAVRKIMPKSAFDMVFLATQLAIMLMGISGALKTENIMIVIISMCVGTLIGGVLKLHDRVYAASDRLEAKLNARLRPSAENGGTAAENSKQSMANAIVFTSLLTCVGAMAIMGPMTAALNGDCSILYSKALIDFFMGIILGATMGIGTLFSGFAIFIYEGAIFLLSGLIAPYLTDHMITEICAVGNLLIMALSLNQFIEKELKLVDMLPAVLIPIVLCTFM